MQTLSTLDTSLPIDFDNLSIVTHPRPPRRRQSGVSLVPFRPYVKCLTSVQQPFSFADGEHQWKTVGENQTIFQQQNARCIGSLIDDCDISDVIRWDIEGESTKLPMMCKLWMIVDGAVVERGKPHLVQDAAVQVYTAGRNYRAILAAEQRFNKTIVTTFDRRRRHSWHDLNEYHSVPYYQYSRSARSGYQDGIQCDLDNEHVTSTQEYLPFLIEETTEETQYARQESAQEIVQNQSILQDRVHISMMTQTERLFEDKTTEIDDDFIEIFNLNLETNENLLSSVVNPYQRIMSNENHSFENVKYVRNNIEYVNECVSTGDDYPQWWSQLSTNIILSDQITKQGQQKTIESIQPSPRQQLDQSSQTDVDNEFENENENEKTRPSSSRSSRIQKSSSSVTINENFEIIDQINDGNNSKRILPSDDHSQKIDSDSHLSDFQNEISSNRYRTRRITTSSKQSDSDYQTFASALNQQSYSTPEPYNHGHTTSGYSSTNENEQIQSPRNPSTPVLANLLQRYERTLQLRQTPAVIINDQYLDIQNLIQKYKNKVEQADRELEIYQNLLNKPKEESSVNNCSSSSSLNNTSRFVRTKYRTLPEITSEQMIQNYIPTPRLCLTASPIHTPRSIRPTRFDYCDLCLNDQESSSAWIRYNEQRIEQLQKRIELMLQIDDYEENFFYSIPILPHQQSIQHINSIRSKQKIQPNSYLNRILSLRRYNFRYPYRANPSSPRLSTRNFPRSTNSLRKSVRICTEPETYRLRQSSKYVSRPIVSILRRSNTKVSSNSSNQIEPTHVWKDESDGKVYILKQFSIPRYYRLYNDVSFREVYYFSRLLDNYLNRTTPENYSNIVRNYAIRQQLPTLTTAA